MHANFAVTRNPEIPSCLVEADFVTSPEGEEAIWNAERRSIMAEAIASGIDDWCKGKMKGNDK
jgi:N-acetylmuramoyl-L-alanine amidase